MKKVISGFMLFFISTTVFAAGCDSGYISSNEYVFQIPDSSSCPAGYTETTGIKIVDNTADCGTGWIVTTRYKEVVCDTSRGTCSSSYVCPAP